MFSVNSYHLPSTHAAAPTCVLAELWRSAVTVAEEAEGTSSVGDFEGAGLAFLPSGGGSTVLGVCWPWFSVKVTDLFWSPCAVGTYACLIKAETTAPASNSLTHQHHQREWRQGQDRRARQGLGGDARQTCRASYWVRLQIKGMGHLQGGEEGLKVVSHLHSPIKFLYFETQGMRQNRVRRVSLETGDTTKNKHRGCEWGGRVISSQHMALTILKGYICF